MSISYYAIPIRDRKLVGPILEGEDVSHPIDTAVRASLLKYRSLQGSEKGTLKWAVDNDYVFVDIMGTHVLVTHNTGRSSYQMEVVMEVINILQQDGLHVYDPQRGDWFP